MQIIGSQWFSHIPSHPSFERCEFLMRFDSWLSDGSVLPGSGRLLSWLHAVCELHLWNVDSMQFVSKASVAEWDFFSKPVVDKCWPSIHPASTYLSWTFMGAKCSSKYLLYSKHPHMLCTLLISTPWPILDLHYLFSSYSLHSKIPSQQIYSWVLHFQDSFPKRINWPSGNQTWQSLIDDVPLKHPFSSGISQPA